MEPESFGCCQLLRRQHRATPLRPRRAPYRRTSRRGWTKLPRRGRLCLPTGRLPVPRWRCQPPRRWRWANSGEPRFSFRLREPEGQMPYAGSAADWSARAHRQSLGAKATCGPHPGNVYRHCFAAALKACLPGWGCQPKCCWCEVRNPDNFSESELRAFLRRAECGQVSIDGQT